MAPKVKGSIPEGAKKICSSLCFSLWIMSSQDMRDFSSFGASDMMAQAIAIQSFARRVTAPQKENMVVFSSFGVLDMMDQAIAIQFLARRVTGSVP
ncbi:unnamed protein product [Caenorhabditis auriculariae]|uniref:Uncharacterized protein n=1 Tax=Caenorhabditis auriculariae TaxID=2777116 RepID=A0A8S1HWM5_9PELO|nr:unnamed protein product [Caenorhabditis auriculariae]